MGSRKNEKWLAEIVVANKYHFLGRYVDLADAKAARTEAERNLY